MHEQRELLSTANPEHCEWLAQRFEAWTTDLNVLKPSEWAESKRYLPDSTTSLPGYYSFRVTPYLREILDCLSVDSPIREVTVMKGVQLGFTVGVIENSLGYCIEHVKSASVMFVTADAELAKLRLESHIVPMLQHSKLDELIKSADETNRRKTGRTDKKIEWFGGGYLVMLGAQNANKLRSMPIRILLRDEIDGWPPHVGKDGDPMKLSEDRTAAYEGSRKIVNISTPTIDGLSKIKPRFLLGDQRRYFVRCLKCNLPQVLRWREENKETGEVTGITWETENGRLIPDSVRYLCQECGHPHTNDDKTRLLSPDHGAEWRPTAAPSNPYHRSYHISALYSPPGMQTWAAAVQKWLEAWDVEHNRPRDMGLLQVFYNNQLGETFRPTGERIRFEQVSSHRRQQYHFGQVPNRFAEAHCGSPVLLLTCAVDVHKNRLAVAVMGWCRDRRAILVDYWSFFGDTERLEDPETWGKLRELIEKKEYVADDKRAYRIAITLVDSGYNTEKVYEFCGEYSGGVYPIKGREAPPKSASIIEFSEFSTPMGRIAYGITVDYYKDRWHAALKRAWDGQAMQPPGHFNAPVDITDKHLKELTAETKRERIEERTQRRLGFVWYRPPGSSNELWDLLVYNNAAMEILALQYCRENLRLQTMNWTSFYDAAQQEIGPAPPA